MTEDRKNEIEKIANEYGFSFASAKWFLENYIENDCDEEENEIMCEMWYN